MFVSDKVENIVGKGENAGDQHFLLFVTMFSIGLTYSHTMTPFDAPGK